MKKIICGLALGAGLIVVACGDGAGDNDGGGAQKCSSTADCGDDSVCLGQGDLLACAPICTVNADACGAEAQCGGVGVLSVNVCQEPQGSGTTPDPEEQPRLPCSTDAECEALQSGAICARFQGQKDCTIRCSQESDCDMPTVGGITIDFMTCIADEADSTRTACLPDVQCFNNPLTCIDFGGGFP